MKRSEQHRQYCLLRDNKRLLRIVRAYITKRLNEGYTFKRIGEESGVHPDKISEYYNYGNRPPAIGMSQVSLLRLCRYLGISVDLKIETYVQ